jgi:glycosyltransferase involved in cell wall biosynthesis
MNQPLVTVCITTYNRTSVTCDLLSRLTFHSSIEYIVVDDGSTAANFLALQDFILKNGLCIKLLRKENGGKLSAFRMALDHAKGKYITDLDSDDHMSATNVENILQSVKEVEQLRSEGKEIVGVVGLSENPEGGIFGDKFKKDGGVHTYIQMRVDQRIKANKVEIILTEKLKEIDIPFYKGEKRMSTNVQWFLLNDSKLLFVNKPFDVYYANRRDSISSKLLLSMVNSKNNTRYYFKLCMKQRHRYHGKRFYLFSAMNYMRFGLHGAEPFIEEDLDFRELSTLIVVFPVSAAWYIYDLFRLKFKRKDGST